MYGALLLVDFCDENIKTNHKLQIFVRGSLIGLKSVMDIVEQPIKFRLPTTAIRCTEDLLEVL